MGFNYNNNIPTLDLNNYFDDSETIRNRFVQDLGQIYSEIGFVAIINHGFTSAKQKALYYSVQNFFELPEETKSKYDGSATGGQRGYTAKGKEHAAGRTQGDLKEFYHIGKEIPGSSLPHYQPNIFPTEAAEFKRETLDTYQKLESIGKIMLQAIAEFLELEKEHFEDKVDKGISILRPIHYFPLTEEVPEGAVRAAEHGDINLITLLMGASAEGLQVKRRDGKWISVTTPKDALVINVGDMLERYTNGKLKSTIHRVVNPEGDKMKTSRYSIPFFMHANPDMRLDCLESCISKTSPKAYEDITAEEFLMQRLREIGLIK